MFNMLTQQYYSVVKNKQQKQQVDFELTGKAINTHCWADTSIVLL